MFTAVRTTFPKRMRDQINGDLWEEDFDIDKNLSRWTNLRNGDHIWDEGYFIMATVFPETVTISRENLNRATAEIRGLRDGTRSALTHPNTRGALREMMLVVDERMTKALKFLGVEE